MDTRDTTLTTTLRGIIKQEIEIAFHVRETEPENLPKFDPWEHKEVIEEIIADFINSNLVVETSIEC